jgi:outer membrane protein assembly factor BamB
VLNGFAVALCAVCLLALPAGARDWVTGGGNPERNCIADVPGPATPFVRWQTSVNGSFGQPVFIWGNKLVTYRYDFTNGPVVCHDIATGETLWTRDLGQPGGRSQPVGFRDGQVYAVEFDGTYPDTLYALADSDGSTVWKARLQVHMYITESVTFAPNGDLIVSCDNFRTARIDWRTGDTVWTAERVWPVSGSADLTIAGSSIYCFGGALVGGALRVYKFDLETGNKLDSAWVDDTHPGGTAPYGNVIVGPDGVLYAHRCADNVTAIADSGDSLHVRWVHEVSADPDAPFAQLACGPDSSIYCYSSGRIVRLDPATGASRDSSPVIKDPSAVFAVHIAVGSDGTVYATNGGYAGGALYSFSPDLQVIWTDPIANVSTANPAIGRHGELAVAGGGTVLKVYEGPLGVGESQNPGRGLPDAGGWRARPNPFRAGVELLLPGSTICVVYDAAGRVRARVPVVGGSARWNAETAAPGLYFGRADGQQGVVALVKQ